MSTPHYVKLLDEFDRAKYPYCAKIFDRIQLYLGDVHAMFLCPQIDRGIDSGCNYSIAVVLLSVLSGLSKTVYPISANGGDHGAFTMLVRDWFKLMWGRDGWIPLGVSAEFLYVNLRNPLVHDLGTQMPLIGRANPGARLEKGFAHTVEKWGDFEPHDIHRLELLSTWPDDIPVVGPGIVPGEESRTSLAGLYHLTRSLVTDLFGDRRVRDMAEHWHSFWAVHQEITPDETARERLDRIINDLDRNQFLGGSSERVPHSAQYLSIPIRDDRDDD